MLVTITIVSLLAVASAGKELKNSRIIGGENASPGDFPHQVSLRDEGRHVCGASIINKLYLLTAAHCVYGKETSGKFSAVTGSILLSEGGSHHEVASIESHENYSRETFENDIAVVKLKEPIDFNENQKPVVLPKADTEENQLCSFSGWGYHLYPGNSSPNNLQKMEASTYTNSECERLHSDGGAKIFPGMICAFNALNIGACKGDSGGPLVLAGPEGPVQVGVASFVWKYCALGVPDVYARVYYYREWIEAHTNIN